MNQDRRNNFKTMPGERQVVITIKASRPPAITSNGPLSAEMKKLLENSPPPKRRNRSRPLDYCGGLTAGKKLLFKGNGMAAHVANFLACIRGGSDQRPMLTSKKATKAPSYATSATSPRGLAASSPATPKRGTFSTTKKPR